MRLDKTGTGAPEAEIEITPAMIMAGIAAYCEWDSRFEEADGLVVSIFQAMEKVARHHRLSHRPEGASLGL